MKTSHRILRANICAGMSILLILSAFFWGVNSSAAQSILPGSILALSEHFNDGELTTNPTWTYNNEAFSIIDGQLYSNGLHTDGSGRYSNFYRTYPTFATSDYLEFSFRAMLKSAGNPQAGQGVKLLIIDASGYPCYELRIQNGYVDGFPINHNSLSFGYCADQTLYDVVVSNFAPEYDRFYNIKAVRRNAEFSLFVDGVLIGQAADPLGLTQFGSVFIATVGSTVIDDIEVVIEDGTQTDQPQITGADMNIYNLLDGTSDGSSPDTTYGFEAFVRAQGDFSTFDASKVTLTVDGNPLYIDHAGIFYDGEMYRINAGSAFESIPSFGEYVITIEDANGQISEPFVIGNLEDYPKDASDLLFPEHQSSIIDSQPIFNWEDFNSYYLGQPIAPWAYEINLVFPNNERYSAFPIANGQTTLDYENPYWDPGQLPALEPGLYRLAVHSNHRVAPGFNFEHHRSIQFEVVPPNQPPDITAITAPVDPIQVGLNATSTVTFIDPDFGDTHTAIWDWGDGSTTMVPTAPPTDSASHAYTTPGVYTISITITDAAGESDTETFQYVVIYDPNDGFVTGGGWINSPEGAYTLDPSLTGKATFGFVSKYQKGANVPTGNTEFQFHVANMNFKSTSYDWLVIAGTKAKYKGTGTINGVGEYQFMLTAIDGSPDKFRIKIWDMATGEVIYDNQPGESDTADPTTAIGGGSIVIHKAK